MASYIDCRVSFQIMSSQLNLLQYKLEKHLTDDQGKQDPPELNYECHGNMYLIHVILLFCFFLINLPEFYTNVSFCLYGVLSVEFSDEK